MLLAIPAIQVVELMRSPALPVMDTRRIRTNRNQKLHLSRTYTVNTLCPCGFITNCKASCSSGDSDKADSNVEKHGVSFHAACEVFFDPFVKIVDASNPTESREAAFG